MAQLIELQTPRLRLRQWRESDRVPFAAMNADPAVMEFFPSLQSHEASDASISAWQSQLTAQGWSNWAVELLTSAVHRIHRPIRSAPNPSVFSMRRNRLAPGTRPLALGLRHRGSACYSSRGV